MYPCKCVRSGKRCDPGGTILTISGDSIENGIIVIRNGKISTIGADVEIPENAKIIDAYDKTVFPGLINPSSHIGLSSPPGGGPSSNPHYRVVDELYPFHHKTFVELTLINGKVLYDKAKSTYFSHITD